MIFRVQAITKGKVKETHPVSTFPKFISSFNRLIQLGSIPEKPGKTNKTSATVRIYVSLPDYAVGSISFGKPFSRTMQCDYSNIHMHCFFLLTLEVHLYVFFEEV